MARRVAIIGAGVIGLSCAHFAAKRGWDVTVIERKPLDRDGCSFGNAGMIVPSHFVPLAAPGMVALGLKWMWNPESPFYIKPRLDPKLWSWAFRFWRSATKSHVAQSAPLIRDLSLQSRQLFVQMQGEGMDFGLEQRGLLMLCNTEHGMEEEASAAKMAESLGIPAEVVTPARLRELEPNVTMDVVGGVWYPKDCHLSPGRYIAALQDSLVQKACNFRFDTEIVNFEMANGRVVAAETTQGNIQADEFVICGGSWSPELAKSLDLRLPMQAGKGYSLTLSRPRELPRLCAIFTEARIAVTPMGQQLRFGGTMELAGLDESVTQRRVQGIIRAIPNYFPAFQADDFVNIVPWRGLRPCSPDGLPYIGRTSRWKNVVVATGHAMMGLSLAPITGQMVSDLLSNETPGFESKLLSPDRFA